MPETIQDYRTATEDNRDLEEIVGGASASAGDIPYQVEVTYSSAEEPSSFLFHAPDEEDPDDTDGANFVVGDGSVIFISDSFDPGSIYPGLEMDWEYPGGHVGSEETPPDNWDMSL